MTAYEITSLIVSIVAFIFSLLAIWLSHRAGDKANRFSEGANEMQYRELIMNATYNMLDKKEKFEADPSDSNTEAALVSVENYLNVYDDLCSLYINGNVEKIHFFRKYRNDIKNLVENKEFKDYYFPKETSKYSNTVRVYEYFENSKPSGKKIR